MRARTAARLCFPAIVVAAVLMSACGGGGSAGSTSTDTPSTTTAAAPFDATLTAPTHRPTVNDPWRYVVRINDATGDPVPATVHLQVLSGGVAVGQIGVHKVVGRWAETIKWPPASIGHALVFEAEVTALGSTVTLHYALTVQPR